MSDEWTDAMLRFDLGRWVQDKGFDQQATGEWTHDCPWCGSEGKLSVNPHFRKWRCFICQTPISFLNLVAAFEGSNEQAVKVVMAGAGARGSNLEFVPELKNPEMDLAMARMRPAGWMPEPIDPPAYFRELDAHHPYTYQRGLDLNNLLLLGVGICDLGAYGRRLIFPVKRLDGRWIYFQARATWEKSEQLPDAKGKVKYQKNKNPKTKDPARFAGPGDVLLGLDLIERHQLRRAVIVEGPTDWIQVGLGAVATFGKNLTPHQVQLLAQAGVTEVVLAWDPDAWEPPTRKMPDGSKVPTGRPPPAHKALGALSAAFDVWVINYHPGTDPGTYTPEQNAQWVAAAQPWTQRGGRLARL